MMTEADIKKALELAERLKKKDSDDSISSAAWRNPRTYEWGEAAATIRTLSASLVEAREALEKITSFEGNPEHLNYVQLCQGMWEIAAIALGRDVESTSTMSEQRQTKEPTNNDPEK